MEQVTFAKEYDHRFSKRRAKNYPKGWSGEVPDAVAAAAREGGYLGTAADDTGAADRLPGNDPLVGAQTPPNAETVDATGESGKPAPPAGSSKPGSTTDAKNVKG